jgi:hypothetical protein
MIKNLPAAERCRSNAEQSLRFYFQIRHFLQDLPIDERLPLRRDIQAALERAQGDACQSLLIWARANGVPEAGREPPSRQPRVDDDEDVDWIKTCELPYIGHP